MIYQVKCKKCKKEFKFEMGMNEDISDKKCPLCETSGVMKKIFKNINVRFKGDWPGQKIKNSGKPIKDFIKT